MGIKHKLFKIILTFTLLAAILSVNIFAVAPRSALTDSAKSAASSVISQSSTNVYNKTISKTYNKFKDVPSKIYYEEYNDSFGNTFGGSLPIENVKIVQGGKYVALFSGTLYSII
ncbi:MAG: hypothetical protein RR508_01725 [Oscillospiraceae bacterium]